jgi:hypothetical protein
MIKSIFTQHDNGITAAIYFYNKWESQIAIGSVQNSEVGLNLTFGNLSAIISSLWKSLRFYYSSSLFLLYIIKIVSQN